MGDKTGIEWADKTWNPWRGCHKVSQGCKNCYMFREQKQYGNDPNIVVRSKTTFNSPLKWKEPAMVFTCSWSDWFIEEADEWREEAWEVIRQTPHLTYQILTKRPGNILDRLPEDWGEGWTNVWLGVSAEDQENADERIPQLLEIPAVIRFVSAEPLLGPINITDNPWWDWRYTYDFYPKGWFPKPIDWVIVGGESGPNCRPMNPDWARSIHGQCKEAGVAFFMKQDSGPRPSMRGRISSDLWIKEFPIQKELVK